MRQKAHISRKIAVQKLRNKDNFTPYIPNDMGSEKHHKTIQNCNKIGLMDAMKNIIAVIKGDQDTEGRYTVGTFSFLLYMLFKAIGGVGMLATVLIGFSDIIAGISYIKNGGNEMRQIIFFLGVLVLMVMFFLYSVMVWGAAKEIEKETDKNYVLAVFSGVVSFASLIFTIMQFLKERS